MEVLVISHKYPPSIGGMQTHCYQLVKSLEKDHTVHKVIYKNNYPKIFFLLTAAYRALQVIKKNPNISVVYTNDALMALFCNPLLKHLKERSIPISVTVHGLDITFPGQWYQRLIKKHLNRFQAIITVSGPTTDLAIKHGLEADRVVKVENAVDIDISEREFDPELRNKLSKILGFDVNDKVIITSLGRPIPRKGFSWFTRNVAPRLPDNAVYFVIARKGQFKLMFNTLRAILPRRWFEPIRMIASAETDDDATNKAIAELKLDGKAVRLTQFTKSREDIFKIIRHSDIFVMPNIHIPGDYEGFGLVALEAAVEGTLTLAADTDGIPSAVVDGVTGHLVPPGDADAWLERINYFIDHPEERKRKAEEFKKNTLSKARGWDTMAERYQEVFQAIVDGKKPGTYTGG